jgi:hypothetical protein
MASSQKMLLTPSSLLNLKTIPELHCHDFEHESIWNESIHTLEATGFQHFTEPEDGEFSMCSSAVREEEELISAMDEAFAEESAEKESMDEYFAEACHQERDRDDSKPPQASKWLYEIREYDSERDSPAENPVAFCEVVDKFQKLREFGEEHTQLAIARAELYQQVFHSKEAVLSLIDSRIARLRELMDRP